MFHIDMKPPSIQKCSDKKKLNIQRLAVLMRITYEIITVPKLTFGLILMEFNDAIKEGDGERLLDVYKVALLIPKANGKSKYAYEVLLYLVKIYGILSRYEAHNMK